MYQTSKKVKPSLFIWPLFNGVASTIFAFMNSSKEDYGGHIIQICLRTRKEWNALMRQSTLLGVKTLDLQCAGGDLSNTQVLLVAHFKWREKMYGFGSMDF